MRKVLSLGIMIATLFAGAAAGLTLDEALALFQHDNVVVAYSDEGRLQLEQIIETLRSALGVTDALNERSEDAVMAFEVPLDQKDVVNKLSQAYYTLANVFISDNENETIYLKGKHWGLKSLRMNPAFAQLERSEGFVDAVNAETDVPALYWATANWLRVSQKNPLQAVFAGVPAKTQAMSERTLELDPAYVSGGSYRSLGAYYSGLPIGRDLNKALFYLCHVVTEPACSACGDCQPALAGADAYFENRTFIAEFYYMEKKMWTDAALVLESVLADPIGDVYPLMNAYSQENARKLLEEVNERL